MKAGATHYQVSGVIRHIRGDDPVNPTQFYLFVDPDTSLVDPKHVSEHNGKAT
jgi:hypothetical protein